MPAGYVPQLCTVLLNNLKEDWITFDTSPMFVTILTLRLEVALMIVLKI